jgi:regulatory protein
MPRVITGLSVQQRNKERVNVFVDGEFAFAVAIDVAARLRKGQQLTPQEMAELREAGQEDLVYGAALRYLGLRPRSEAEVVRYLERKGHDAALIGKIVARLRRRGYVDDAAFAQFWVENRNRFRPRGRAALRQELRQKGIEGETIDAALSDQDEESAAWAAVTPKLDRWAGLDQAEFEQKVMGYLARRGFGYGVCRDVSRAAWQRQAEGRGDQA